MATALGRLLPMALGEGSVWLSQMAVFALVSRHLGIAELGALHLGLLLLQLATTLSDLGTRNIGARLITLAAIPRPLLVSVLARRRLVLLVPALVLSWAYAYWAATRGLTPALLIFPLAAVFALLSHDWLLWGGERLWELGVARLLTASAWLLGALATVALGGGITALALASLLAAAIGTGWTWWRSREIVLPLWSLPGTVEELGWPAARNLALAVLANQAFQTVDSLLLGMVGTDDAMGTFGMSLRLLMLALGVWYLATQAFFPAIVRHAANHPRPWRLLMHALAGSLALGLALAAPLAYWAAPVLTALYGDGSADTLAVQCLAILAWALPMEFAMALWGTWVTAAGRYRQALAVTAVGAACRLGLAWIGWLEQGLVGMAWATVASYGVVMALIARSILDWSHSRTQSHEQR